MPSETPPTSPRTSAARRLLHQPPQAALARRLVVAALLLQAWPAAAATLSAEEAGRHAGENATVCGTVASAHFARTARTAPTFLDLDQPYPDAIFTIVIFGRDRAKFGAPEKTLLRQRICVTGAISLYRGRPEMILDDPAQLRR